MVNPPKGNLHLSCISTSSLVTTFLPDDGGAAADRHGGSCQVRGQCSPVHGHGKTRAPTVYTRMAYVRVHTTTLAPLYGHHTTAWLGTSLYGHHTTAWLGTSTGLALPGTSTGLALPGTSVYRTLAIARYIGVTDTGYSPVHP